MFFAKSSQKRQLFISTHDERFGNLLKRKLRAVTEVERTIVLEITDWTRDGPTVREYDALREASRSAS